MRRHVKLLLTTLGAGLALAATVGSASARRVEISSQGIRNVFSPLEFTTPSEGAFIARCPATLEGTFHSRTISKVGRALIGFITRAILAQERCLFSGTEAVSILSAGLPWHVRYDSFSGVLPTPTEVRLQILGFSILIQAFGVSCLYKSSEASPLYGTLPWGPGGWIFPGLQIDESREIPKFSGSFLCPASMTVRNSGSVATVLGRTENVFLRLVS